MPNFWEKLKSPIPSAFFNIPKKGCLFGKTKNVPLVLKCKTDFIFFPHWGRMWGVGVSPNNIFTEKAFHFKTFINHIEDILASRNTFSASRHVDPGYGDQIHFVSKVKTDLCKVLVPEEQAEGGECCEN